MSQVLDPRTRMALFKMLNQGLLTEINGCISTGKEANVYHALGTGNREYTTSQELAVKIFKTSILVFKDRDKYVSGDYRFRNGYSRHNPRKMVKMWAEKEFRNLTRLTQVSFRLAKPALPPLPLPQTAAPVCIACSVRESACVCLCVSERASERASE